MPSPLSKNNKAEKPEVIQITESALTCEVCFLDSDKGVYFPKTEKLVWICACGHRNEVKDIHL